MWCSTIVATLGEYSRNLCTICSPYVANLSFVADVLICSYVSCNIWNVCSTRGSSSLRGFFRAGGDVDVDGGGGDGDGGGGIEFTVIPDSPAISPSFGGVDGLVSPHSGSAPVSNKVSPKVGTN